MNGNNNNLDNKLETYACILLYCSIAGIILLSAWFIMFAAADEWIYSIHSKWFTIAPQQFHFIHYFGMMLTNIFVMLLFVIPFICLTLARKRTNKKIST